MLIKKTGIAGTLESSDVQVVIEPAESGIDIAIQSSVMNQYGRQIKQLTLETLRDLGVENASISLIDSGALECTLKARIECAVYRGAESSVENIPWGSLK